MLEFMLRLGSRDEVKPRRWVNFHKCPHCKAHNRPTLLERLDENIPIISRSDGVNFHLVMGGWPVVYPVDKQTGIRRASAGFWYVHEANRATETVVVLLETSGRGGTSLAQLLNIAADRLYEKLSKENLLEHGYDFENNRLHSFG